MLKKLARWILFDLEFKPLYPWCRRILFKGDK